MPGVFKLYVDSRFRVETGGPESDAQFTIELPHPIQVKGRAYVDTVCLANTFLTIRGGENDRLHVRENQSTYRVCGIAEGQYNVHTLKTAVQSALNLGRSMTGTYTVDYEPVANKLKISNSDATASFHIYPDQWLKENADLWNTNAFAGGGPVIDGKHLMSAGSVCGFTSGAYKRGGANI